MAAERQLDLITIEIGAQMRGDVLRNPNLGYAMALVRLNVGDSPLIARLTKRSIAALGVREGIDVWARIKAVALIG